MLGQNYVKNTNLDFKDDKNVNFANNFWAF